MKALRVSSVETKPEVRDWVARDFREARDVGEKMKYTQLDFGGGGGGWEEAESEVDGAGVVFTGSGSGVQESSKKGMIVRRSTLPIATSSLVNSSPWQAFASRSIKNPWPVISIAP